MSPDNGAPILINPNGSRVFNQNLIIHGIVERNQMHGKENGKAKREFDTPMIDGQIADNTRRWRREEIGLDDSLVRPTGLKLLV